MDEKKRQAQYDLHVRLLNGDVTVSAEIAEQYLYEVIEQLHRRYSRLYDQDKIDTAVDDAFMRYYQYPERYNPAKSSLTTYLLMSAEGDLRNSLRCNTVIEEISV